MWVVLKKDADAERVRAALQGLGLWTEWVRSKTEAAPVLAVAAHSRRVAPDVVAAVHGVASVTVPPSTHPLVDAQSGRPILAGRVPIGGGAAPVLVAGPCSAESEAQVRATAAMVARVGAQILRGGAFKPRTSPYGFRGHGRPALGWLRRAADAEGLGLVTEVVHEADVDAVAEVADLVQIGSRNMQNFALLEAVGRSGRPVLLKRGLSARIEEWLLAGEYLLAAGARGVVFCERGVLCFDPQTRNLLDLGAVALLRHVYRQPVLVDPSHAAGRRDLIPALARAALAAGADGIFVEAHPDASAALTDGAQALDATELSEVAGAFARGL